jgi:hypothetical protein
MKRILFFILLISSIVAKGQTDDAAKYVWYRYKYGNREPRGQYDSVLLIPLLDTTIKPNRAGGLTMRPADKLVYYWDGTKWSLFAGGGIATIQSAATAGNKTTLSIGAKGISTPYLQGDTANDQPFEFIFLPDIQGMNRYQPSQLYAMFQYFVDHKVSENIQGVFGLGDICDNAATAQMQRADTMFKRIDTLGIPYLPIMGNHDYDSDNPASRGSTLFNSVFGNSRFAGKSWYGGHWSGSGTENMFIKFDVGHFKYLVLGLEFLPRDGALTWADSVIKANTDRQVIVTTHAHITTYGERSRDTSQWATGTYSMTGNNGIDIWNKILKNNKNVSLIVNGHFIDLSNNREYVKRYSDVGDSGNVIHQILINYQRDSAGGGVNTGEGYFSKFRINPKTGKVTVSFYSTLYNAYDPQEDSFYVDAPAIRIENSIGVNNLYAKGEARFRDKVFMEQIPLGSFVKVVGVNGEMGGDDMSGFWKTNGNTGTLGAALLGTIDAQPFTIKTNNTTRTTYLSSSQINNTVSQLQVASNGATSVNSSLEGNFPGTLFSVHGSGNWGTGVIRASNDNGAANMFLYKTRSSDPIVRTPGTTNDLVGRITFMTPDSGNTIRRSAFIESGVESVGASSVAGYMAWWTSALGGTYLERSRINSLGQFMIGTTTPFNGATKLTVSGSGEFSDSLTITTMGTSDSSNRAASTAWVKRQGFGSSGSSGGSTSMPWDSITSKPNSGLFIYDNTTAQTSAHFNVGGYGIVDTIYGSTASGGNLSLFSTSHATKGKILFGTSGYDEVNNRLGIGTTSPGSDVQINNSGNVSEIKLQSFSSTYHTELTNNAANNGDFYIKLNGNSISNQAIFFRINGNDYFRFQGTGRAYFGGNGTSIAPTAILHLAAGTATANTAPLKFTSGTNLTTPEAGAMEFDGSHLYFTIGSTRYQLDQQNGYIQSLSSQYTDVGNVLTGEDDLMSYTLPANTLVNNGDWLEIKTHFKCASNANDKTVIFYFGSFNQTWSTTSGNFAASGATLDVTIRITRVTSSTQKIEWEFGSTSGSYLPNGTTGSIDLTSSALIKFTGTATATDDIIQKPMQIVYHKAP